METKKEPKSLPSLTSSSSLLYGGGEVKRSRAVEAEVEGVKRRKKPGGMADEHSERLDLFRSREEGRGRGGGGGRGGGSSTCFYQNVNIPWRFSYL